MSLTPKSTHAKSFKARGIVSPAGPVSSLEGEVTPVGEAVLVVRAVSACVVLARGSSRGHWGKSVISTSPPVRNGSWSGCIRERKQGLRVFFPSAVCRPVRVTFPGGDLRHASMVEKELGERNFSFDSLNPKSTWRRKGLLPVRTLGHPLVLSSGGRHSCRDPELSTRRII
ncbi:unnamed protein product [Boreogadus saida]